jgi:hypothetical protein
VETQVVSGLKVGNEALKKVNEILSIEEVEQILDETRESVEKQNEIDALLSGVLDEEDEDAVLNELDQLIAEESIGHKEDIRYVDEDIGDQLPDVPTDELKKEKESEHNIICQNHIIPTYMVHFVFCRGQREEGCTRSIKRAPDGQDIFYWKRFGALSIRCVCYFKEN